MRKIFFFVLVTLLSAPAIWAQRLERFGLEGKKVTALAIYYGSLYAGTDGDGVLVRNLYKQEAGWDSLGPTGVRIRAIYPHQVGPFGFAITVGTEPDRLHGDSTLVYCSLGDHIWVLADSGMDRSQMLAVRALDGFPTIAI